MPTGPEVAPAQYDAIVEWGIPDASQLNRLAGIRQPTLVPNGDNNRMTPTGGVVDRVGDGSGDADEADLADALGSSGSRVRRGAKTQV